MKCSNWACVPWRAKWLGVTSLDSFAYVFAGDLNFQRFVDSAICEGDYVKGLFLGCDPSCRCYGPINFCGYARNLAKIAPVLVRCL